MFRTQKKRAARARKNALALLQSAACVDTNQAPDPKELLAMMPAGAIVAQTNNCIVTEVGFVTMAVLPELASRVDDFLVVPGADDRNLTGFLVMIPDRLPYHSLVRTVPDAVKEARLATHRADQLLTVYGGKPALRTAARSAPWHLMVRPQDIAKAGICTWGANSFLGRYGLRKIAFSVGLPRLVLRIAGAYGDRLTATALLRKEQANCLDGIPTGLKNSA